MHKALAAVVAALGVAFLTLGASSASAQPSDAATRVTVMNFARAESDRYFGNVIARNGIGHLGHFRQMVSVAAQPVIRANLDTLYSSGVFDLDAGPVTITLPGTHGRFMSLQAINEDHYTVGVYDAPGAYTFTREQAGTRYLLLGMRTFADPRNAADLDAAHALQDATIVSQGNTGVFERPNWDDASLTRLRESLNSLMGHLDSDDGEFFGTREEVDPVLHLIGAAALWGGNPRSAAIYLNRFPTQNDGETVYRLTVADVPIDGFWSVTVYNANGYLEANARNAYSINNVTARRDRRGRVTVQFGGCTDTTPNCLPTMPGWNYTVRLYRPRAEILSGAWRFPEGEFIPARLR